jgi:hypothetical protein
LVLLGTLMVVYGKECLLFFFTTGAQIHGGFTAIATDFKTRPHGTGLKGNFV